MRPASRLKLNFYPLPVAEAIRLRNYLSFPPGGFSALDPCVGDGVAFSQLLLDQPTVHRYGIEIESGRAEQARRLGIDVIYGDAMEVHCPAGSIGLLYMNPPYDFESGQISNRRLELVFLRQTYRSLQPGGVLLFVIPQLQLKTCARLIAEQFTGIRAYRFTEAACLQYKQIVVFAVRRKRSERVSDDELWRSVSYLEKLAGSELPDLTETPDCIFPIPSGGPTTLTNNGLPLDEIEDAILISSAYRQIARLLIRWDSIRCRRPITPLHGGHVGLLCTAGMLNGAFGEGSLRHMSCWHSRKYSWRQSETDEDGTETIREREAYTHELTLVFADGRTEILTHEEKSEDGGVARGDSVAAVNATVAQKT
jgi:Uncharacterised methyltransferase family (DUF6094)